MYFCLIILVMLNQIKTCEPETKANFILKQYEFIYSYLEIKPRIPGILEAIIDSLKNDVIQFK